MYPLFLETKAFQQVRQFCVDKGLPPGRCVELQQAAYDNAVKYHVERGEPGGFDGRLFSKYVKEDDVWSIDINLCFDWASTPQGRDLWSRVHNTPVRKP